MNWNVCLMALLIVCGSLFSPGCGPSSQRTYRVCGRVFVDDQPLPSGDILFVARDKSVGPAGGKIKDGAFELFAKPGEMSVEIRASRAVPELVSEAGPLYRESLPAVYNSQTTLRVDIEPNHNYQFTFRLVRSLP